MRQRNLWLATLLCVIGSGGLDSIAAEGDIYWTTVFGRSIKHSDLASPAEEIFLSGLSVTTGIAVDVEGERIYWGGKQPDGIFRASLDGTDIERIIEPCGPSSLCSAGMDLTLELASGKIYWTESGTDPVFYAIKRANLDGTDIEDVITEDLTRPSGLDIDLTAGKIYWTEGAVPGVDGKIRRADLDGTNVEDLITVGVNSPMLELDLACGKMYWTSNNEGEIWRANLDGSMSELLVDGLANPLGLQLDLINDQLYWADHHAGKIQRANLDGTQVEDFLITDSFRVEGIAVIPAETGIAALLDIRPGSCPNPLNRSSRGVLPVALVGTEDFDVMQVDVDSLELTRADGFGGSVTPLMGPPGPGIRVEDVATPFDGEPCDCHKLGGDGVADLAMKFDTPGMVSALALDDLPGGSSVELVVSGELLDTTHFSAADCVILVPPGSGPGALPAQSGPEGGSVDAVPEPPRKARPDNPDGAQDGDAPDEMSPQLVGCGVLPPGFLLAATAAMYLVSRARPVARRPE